MAFDYKDPRQVISDEEAALALDVRPEKIRAAKRSGHLPVLTLGKQQLIPRQAFERWLALELKLPEAPPVQDRSAAVAKNVEGYEKNWAESDAIRAAQASKR